MLKDLKKLNCRNKKIEILFISTSISMAALFLGISVDAANAEGAWIVLSNALYAISDVMVVYALYALRKENKCYRNAFYLFTAGTVCSLFNVLNIYPEYMEIGNDLFMMPAVFILFDGLVKTVKKGTGTRAVMLGQCGKILQLVVTIEDTVWLTGFLCSIFIADVVPTFILVSEKIEAHMYFSIQTLIAAFTAAIMFIDEKVTD